MGMFEVREVTEEKVTLIDFDDEAYQISQFYGKNQYGQDGRVGVHHDEFPDEISDVSEADMVGWTIVVSEYPDPMYSEEAETKTGMIESVNHKSDGRLIDYVE